MDPLSLLREFCMKDKLDKVSMSRGRVEFGDEYSFDEKMATAFKSQRGTLYSLKAVVFFIKNAMIGTYYQTALAAEIETIARVDVKELTEYLHGRIETCSKITPPDNLPVSIPPMAKRNLEDDDAPEGVEPKRQRTSVDNGVVKEGAAVEGEKFRNENKKKVWNINSIMRQERQLRDRNAQLICPGKDFGFAAELAKRHMQEFRHKVKISAEKGRVSTGHHRNEGHVLPAAEKRPKIPVKPSNRYERPLPQNEVENLAGPQFAGIGVSLYGMRSLDHVRKSDVGDPPSGSQIYSGHVGQRRDMHKRSLHRGERKVDTSQHTIKPNPESLIPIILVPAGLSAKINMYNARYLLEESKYIPVEECRALNPKKKDTEFVLRSFGRSKPVKYQLMEKAPHKMSRDWARVVAVISQGVKWQFKDFPFKGADQGNMMETFTRIQGFYFAFHNEELTPLVESWNVHTIVIHKDNRHNDIPVMQEFFRKLDSFLQTKKAKLVY